MIIKKFTERQLARIFTIGALVGCVLIALPIIIWEYTKEIRQKIWYRLKGEIKKWKK